MHRFVLASCLMLAASPPADAQDLTPDELQALAGKPCRTGQEPDRSSLESETLLPGPGKAGKWRLKGGLTMKKASREAVQGDIAFTLICE
jgi:hypothetical protein